MALITLKCDVDGPLKGIIGLKADQLPFTIARALTMTAQDAQMESQQLAVNVFKLRNDWTIRNIKITPATKTKLVAEVYTDTSNRSTGAPDYLPPQEDGAEKVPHNGHAHLAIPTRYLWALAGSKVIPTELRPKNLLGAGGNGRFLTSRRQGRERQLVLKNQVLVRGWVFWESTQPWRGKEWIFGRNANVKTREVFPMYELVPEAEIKPRFPMEQAVQARVEKAFPANFTAAAAEVMSNDLLRGSGLTVKF
jgi:hypothetical protein